MTIRVISGTIIDAKDTFGIMKDLIDSGSLIQWVYTKQGWTKRMIPSISTPIHGKFSIIQPVGAGKTVLGATYVYISHKKGLRIGGNLSLKWTENNYKKNKTEWKATISCMEDLEMAHHTHIIMDDVRRTIIAWNTKDAKLVSEVANASGKKQNWIDITTQRIQNFVPPDLMMLCDEIIVPYIRCKDMSVYSPRGQGKPIQIIAFRFSPGYELLSYKVYDYNNKTGEEILNGFDTLQIAESLKSGEHLINGKPGIELENEAFEYLKTTLPNFKWEHLVQKQFDIVSQTHAIDVISVNDDGYGITDHKTWSKKIGAAKAKSRIPYLMFKTAGDWKFIKIKPDLPEGKLLDFTCSSIYNRIRTLDENGNSK
jgi:hypothetical protein